MGYEKASIFFQVSQTTLDNIFMLFLKLKSYFLSLNKIETFFIFSQFQIMPHFTSLNTLFYPIIQLNWGNM